jgi:hypothetical protein
MAGPQDPFVVGEQLPEIGDRSGDGMSTLTPRPRARRDRWAKLASNRLLTEIYE